MSKENQFFFQNPPAGSFNFLSVKIILGLIYYQQEEQGHWIDLMSSRSSLCKLATVPAQPEAQGPGQGEDTAWNWGSVRKEGEQQAHLARQPNGATVGI